VNLYKQEKIHGKEGDNYYDLMNRNNNKLKSIESGVNNLDITSLLKDGNGNSIIMSLKKKAVLRKVFFVFFFPFNFI
jgi:hypothetical protein